MPKKTPKPSPAVYFTELRLRNVRCFGDEEQVLNLTDAEGKPARWTVLLGDNGNGKTTVLECLIAVHRYCTEIWGAYEDPATGSFNKAVRSHFVRQDSMLWGDQFFGQEGDLDRAAREGPRTVQVSMCPGSSSNNGAARSSKYSEQVKAEWHTDKSVFRGFGMLPSGTFPAAVYGASRSQSPASGTRSRTVLQNTTMLKDTSAWLRDLDYSALRAKSNVSVQRRLETAVNVVVAMLPNVSALRFTVPSTSGSTPRVEVDTPDGWVPLDRTAYGYQTLFVWVLDLVARLFEHYPDSDDPLSEPAVVLVDEIELHLHPSWQRSVLKFLDEKFPRVQWIVTTHSPLVAQAAPEVGANLAVLERKDGGPVTINNSPDAVRGWRVDQVLASDLFGTGPRDEATQAVLDQRRDLLRKPTLSAADTKQLGELEAQLDSIPLGESREEVRDRTLLQETLEVLSRRAAKPPAAEVA